MATKPVGTRMIWEESFAPPENQTPVFQTCVDSYVAVSVSEKHTVSIFNPEETEKVCSCETSVVYLQAGYHTVS
jgi:hypothetical protein